MTVIIFIAVLALLILVHELGHYVTALRNGVAAHEFGFGFPPRIVGFVKDDEAGKWHIVGRKEKKKYKNTIFSLNWIPLGGFVQIKGEDGTDKSVDSFAMKSAWVRFKILVAGVMMNLVLAWVLFSIAMMVGLPSSVEDGTEGAQVRIAQVVKDSPAQHMGLKMGDHVTHACKESMCNAIDVVSDLQEFSDKHRGESVSFGVIRGEEELVINGTLRDSNVESKGAIGVNLVLTRDEKLSFFTAIIEGAKETWEMLVLITVGLGTLFWQLVTGSGVSADVAGPVGIAVMTGEIAALGIAHLAQFAAVLSVNLAVINILPIPALDGGRILFVIIEKLRGGKPVNKKVEGIVHGVSFMLLILLMLIVTVRDVLHFF